MKKGFLEDYKTYDTSSGYGNASQWRKAFRQRMSKEEAQTIMSGQEQKPFEILGISENASQSEIKTAFRKLIKQWHPDKNAHRLAEAETQSKLILAAYSELSD